ncbi:MAG: hypothetical protein R3C30_03590 [Hyphomonadaceae bacterium]
MAMFDHNPVLRERLMGLGAFAGIAVFAVTAVDVMVTGGFDFAPAHAAQRHEQPAAYVRMVDAAHYVSDRVRTVSWETPMPVSEAYAAPSEDLAGANDGTPVRGEATNEQLYQEIAALYQRSERQRIRSTPAHDERAYDETESASAPAPDATMSEETEYAPASADEFSPEEAEKLAIASGTW